MHSTIGAITALVLLFLLATGCTRVARAADAALARPYAISPKATGKAWAAKQTRHSWTLGPDSVAVDPAPGP